MTERQRDRETEREKRETERQRGTVRAISEPTELSGHEFNLRFHLSNFKNFKNNPAKWREGL